MVTNVLQFDYIAIGYEDVIYASFSYYQCYITKRHTFEIINDALLNVTPTFQQLYKEIRVIRSFF